MFRACSFFFGLLAGVLLVALLTLVAVRFLASMLVVAHEPVRADAIVALAGDGDGSRLRAALRLYEQGLAPTLVHVNALRVNKASVLQKLCRECKLVEEKIVFLEGSADTRTDAQISLKYCQENNLRKILVVTSPYHTRRTQFIFNDIYEGSGIESIVISSDAYENFVPPDGRWWTDRKTLEFIWLEFGKILYWELTPFMEFQGDGTKLNNSEVAR